MNKINIHSWRIILSDKIVVFNAGREVFFLKGYKDTNVSEIAKKAGIAVGSFYKYYTSKEELFLEVYIDENERLKKKLFESVDAKEDPVTLVTRMVVMNATEMNTNKILCEWYNKDLFEKLEKFFMEKGGMKRIEEMSKSGIVALIKQWRDNGMIKTDLDDDMIYTIFMSIPFIDLHKSEIGIGYFPEILFHITRFIMKGISSDK